MNVDAVTALVAAGATIVDVREQDEFRGELGHIADSQLVPTRHAACSVTILAQGACADLGVPFRRALRQSSHAATGGKISACCIVAGRSARMDSARQAG